MFVVRHGASVGAVPGEAYPFRGRWSDPELSPVGREQAERIADRLVHEPIAAIYVSNLVVADVPEQPFRAVVRRVLLKRAQFRPLSERAGAGAGDN
jgi:hypothetical protein